MSNNVFISFFRLATNDYQNFNHWLHWYHKKHLSSFSTHWRNDGIRKFTWRIDVANRARVQHPQWTINILKDTIKSSFAHIYNINFIDIKILNSNPHSKKKTDKRMNNEFHENFDIMILVKIWNCIKIKRPISQNLNDRSRTLIFINHN